MALRFAANRSELVEDEPLAVTLGEEQIALYLLDGEVYATHNVCTRQYALLSDGYVEDGCIECPLHQGKFDIKTGAAMCAPVTQGVRVYPVHIEGDAVMIDC
ncbi:MAG: Ferredoxin subunits of nitrite reductase and ring-hydroxylating dioxygenases [uncultured Paraburkholderia sp.]|nr:MAG: Ferredoxin subunits of nitrite reductase and ring-hydroxylating dioxygenases [uncultured Paraburkholderia sp.]CAH2805105.1 MAG: Ferredoxin subunits of nitrite reductase and ring-hydroxylating dioxygenases [uncultured Paraburkholderia sp.]CAH2904652.1 MAG: Ferredoxin subunits of nitrite reductase and ring-hydroxylating dioxygenases [uncultured Paraburkholderia sp.]CAH2940229.1 MAG: Ferredoxin subunits of nitrite reductase and ring-hydroxylating dioxygenases [uncultured Paraburkholderia sp